MSTELDIARDIARTLIDAGHETYFAGGCVRDRLLGKPPVDVAPMGDKHALVALRVRMRCACPVPGGGLVCQNVGGNGQGGNAPGRSFIL